MENLELECKPIYKCRQCGKKFEQGERLGIDDASNILLRYINEQHLIEVEKVWGKVGEFRQFEIHECKKMGRIGIADFVGLRSGEEEEDSESDSNG